MAAIAAGRASEGKIRIIILERMNRVGRKILSTGNGRCNFSNRNAAAEHYFGREPQFVNAALSSFGVNDTLELFDSLGIFAKEEEEGKLYPYSDQASSVLDALRAECERLGTEVKTGFDVKEIKPLGNGFKITSYGGETLKTDKVIVACGGCASPDLGSNGSGFKLMEALGHRTTKLSPALVQIRLKADFLKTLSGIKVRGKISLIKDGAVKRSESGEILFTDYGVSGPPVFRLSGFINGRGGYEVSVDFMQDFERKRVSAILHKRRENLSHLRAESFFTGLFHKRIGTVIAKRAGIEKLSLKVCDISDGALEAMTEEIKSFKMPVEGLNGWKSAQVCAGGLLTEEFDPHTLESVKVKGLYCCGEIMDIYGECGGYNLQWAWSSGYAAGVSAAGSLL